MADAGDILGPRRAQMRAATFALSALLICLTLTAILLITWRTHLNNPADQGVRTWIEEAPKPRPAPPPAVHAPPPRGAMPALGNPSDIPGAAVLAQMLTCFGAERDKHPECGPRWSDPELAAGPTISPRGVPTPPRQTRAVGIYTPAHWADLPPDACGRGHGSFVDSGASVCARLPDPPPPSKSPEEICEAGLIGPCHPPAFRPEDVVHHQHTD